MAQSISRAVSLFSKLNHVANKAKLLKPPKNCIRYLSTSLVLNNEGSRGGNILKLLWDSADDVSAPSDAHSKTLTDNKAITYEIVFEVVKPEHVGEYTKITSEVHTFLDKNEDYPGTLVGSWGTLYGDTDNMVHLWMYKEGYNGMTQQQKFERQNEELINYNKQKYKWVLSRRNQICHHFGYWGVPQPRQPEHVYELRTYSLKPGTLIEWANRWGQAIKIRRKDAVGGFFTQIGDLYQVHHVWAYRDLAHRSLKRETMWETPGWDDCVAATVPLIREMKASILSPNPHSPMQ